MSTQKLSNSKKFLYIIWHVGVFFWIWGQRAIIAARVGVGLRACELDKAMKEIQCLTIITSNSVTNNNKNYDAYLQI